MFLNVSVIDPGIFSFTGEDLQICAWMPFVVIWLSFSLWALQLQYKPSREILNLFRLN